MTKQNLHPLHSYKQTGAVTSIVLESFVFGERLKHSTAADDDYQLLYYRDADKFEMDVVIENSAGKLVVVAPCSDSPDRTQQTTGSHSCPAHDNEPC